MRDRKTSEVSETSEVLVCRLNAVMSWKAFAESFRKQLQLRVDVDPGLLLE